MDISVVILTYNRQEQVVNLVRTLRSHYPSDLEIIVTDDGSDPKPDLAGLCVHLWQEDHGIRAATARNRGIEHATWDKIVFLDDDVLPHPLLLQAHDLALRLYDISCGLLPREDFSPQKDVRTRFFLAEDQVMWRFAWTGNLAVRRSVISRIGMFDERFNGGHGYEDIDFGRRAQIAGLRFHLNKLAIALHPAEHLASRPNDLVMENKQKYLDKWGDEGIGVEIER